MPYNGYGNGDSRLCKKIWTLLKFLQQLERVEESDYREPTTFIASAYMQIQFHCPLPMFALYLSKGRVNSDQLDVDELIETWFHWKI